MSIFKEIGKVFNYIPKKVEQLGSKSLEMGEHALGLPTGKERKQQQQMLNEQISAYKQQTELSRQELNRAKDEQASENRRIQEKQIRTIRRNSSLRGFLGSSGNESEPGMSSKLGA